VHDLPDHVYFNHSVHVNAGFGCTECHGQVDEMAVVWRENDLTMGWCLDCHRNPEQYIRPVEEVWNMDYEHPANQLEQGQALIEAYGINVEVLDNCYNCHR
jgi:Zn ribbon nucleic-acid-binding protein